MNDDDLREQLERRTTSAPLTATERVALVEGVHAHTAGRRSGPTSWFVRLGIPVAAAATVIAFVLIFGFPRAPQTASGSPTPGGTPTASAEPSPPPSQSSSPSAAPLSGLPVLSAVELTGLVIDPTAIGQVVVSDAVISFVPSPTQFDVPDASPQAMGTIGSIVVMGESFPNTDWPVHAFRILDGGRLLYLAAVNDDTNNGIWTVPDAIAAAPPEASSLLYAVQGWLLKLFPAPCVQPPDPSAPNDYWCGGSWLVDEPVSQEGPNGEFSLVIPNAIHVQWDAYADFAADPVLDAITPRAGTYLVRPAGCPPNVMGDCPVWEMVGRLDSTRRASDVPTPPAPAETAPSPTPLPSPVGGFIYCTSLDALEKDLCLNTAGKVIDSANPEIAWGAALLVDYECPPGAWCAALTPMIAVEVVPGWTDSSALRSWTLQQGPNGPFVVDDSPAIPDYIVSELPRGGPWFGSLTTPTAVPTLAPTPTPMPPATFASQLVRDQTGVQVTVKFANDPLISGQLNEIDTELRNTSNKKAQWVSDPCEIGVGVRGEMQNAQWPVGVDQTGAAGKFKAAALAYGPGSISILFRPAEGLGQPDFGCGDIALLHTLAPGETFTNRLFWDGMAGFKSIPPPAGVGQLTISPECLIFAGSQQCSDQWSFEHTVSVVNASDTVLLSPAEAIDAALTDSAFVDWLGTVNFQQVTPVVWYEAANRTWHVGVSSGSYPNLTLHLVDVDAISGAVLQEVERPWVKGQDPLF